MQAIVYEDYGDENVLSVKSVPKPIPRPHGVLVKVVCAGVNPVDWKLRAGYIKDWPHKAPFIPGWDVAGIVEAVGKQVKRFKVNDKVGLHSVHY